MASAIANKVKPATEATEMLIPCGVFEFVPWETIFEGEKHSVYASALLPQRCLSVSMNCDLIRT